MCRCGGTDPLEFRRTRSDPAGRFHSACRVFRLINPIGEFVLREACIHCKYWNDMGHPEYKVNVNLSVVQLLQNDIVERIAHVIEETRITPQNLTLEVTEVLQSTI